MVSSFMACKLQVDEDEGGAGVEGGYHDDKEINHKEHKEHKERAC